MRISYKKKYPIIIFSISLFISFLIALPHSSSLQKSGFLSFSNQSEIYENLDNILLNLLPNIPTVQTGTIKNLDHSPDNKTNLLSDIKVERNPVAVAVNELLNIVYVANYGDNSVSVIDGETNRIIENIIVDGPPTGIAVNPVTNMTYVSINNDPSAFTTVNGSIPIKKKDTVSVIDGRIDRVVREITVDEEPTGIAVNPVTNMIYVSTSNKNMKTVSLINGSTNDFITNMKIANINQKDDKPNPQGIAVDTKTNTIFVALSSTLILFLL